MLCLYVDDDLSLAWLGDVVCGDLKLVNEFPAVCFELLSRVLGMSSNEEDRHRVLAIKRLSHVFRRRDALVVIDQDYVDRSAKLYEVVDAPRANREDYDDQQSIAERQFSSQAVHGLLALAI
jgi:hypothetical protein